MNTTLDPHTRRVGIALELSEIIDSVIVEFHSGALDSDALAALRSDTGRIVDGDATTIHDGAAVWINEYREVYAFSDGVEAVGSLCDRIRVDSLEHLALMIGNDAADHVARVGRETVAQVVREVLIDRGWLIWHGDTKGGLLLVTMTEWCQALSVAIEMFNRSAR